MTQTTIRAVTEHDVDIIIALAHEIWPICYKDILNAAQIENLLTHIYTPENLKEEMANGHYFALAHKTDTPIGFGSAYKKNADIWIRKLYILPDQQGSGVGTQILREICSKFLPAENIKLLVNMNNTQAQTYYKAKKFTREGSIPVQMGDYHFTDYIYSCPTTFLL